MVSIYMLSYNTNSIDVSELQTTIKNLILRNTQLEEMLRLLRGERFGKSSEKLNEEQLRLFNLPVEEKTPDIETSTEKIAGYDRKKGGRKKLPPELERVRVTHDLKPEEKQCPCGCGEMEKIGEEVSEKLDIIPSEFRVIQDVRFKYACKKCSEGVYIAELPEQIIPKSNATPNLLAHIAISKFEDALPLNRQTKIFKRYGFELSRGTMATWMIHIGKKIQPIINLIQEHIIDSSYIGIDETKIQVLKEKDRKADNLSYMWVMRGGPPGKTATIFYYDPHRNQEVLKKLIEGFKGYLQCDGLQIYNVVESNQDIRLLGCFAHARRYFHKALKSAFNKDSIAFKTLEFIRKLYKIESEIKEQTAEERYKRRQAESNIILNELKTWLDDVIIKVPPQSLTGDALHYLNSRWKYLIRYIEDGNLLIDNNAVENAIRPFVIGRKNWLFCDTPEGAYANSNLYTLIETAKNNKLDPFNYLSLVFNKLPSAKTLQDYENLLPWNL
ncbi:MAG: hypothetical protein ACD_79C00206G0003 [uncultured bacterium]|nr:MAG: hypothetical protein ACD_79C00206G0003 [uncultured bacterium]